MLTDVMLLWRGSIILTRDIELASARSEFYLRVRRGEFFPVLRGAYVRADVWQRASADERYRLRLSAARELEPEAVFSHESAAAVWRLPMVGGWPTRVHMLQPRSSTDRSTSVFIRHSSDATTESVAIGEFRVTPLARTVVDFAASAPFGVAVALADAALRRTDHPVAELPGTSMNRSQLISALSGIPKWHGSEKARRVVEFADGGADRPGESLSRAAMSIARITPPLLQVVLFGASGTRYVVDFWWPEFNIIGEFDGWAKYEDPEFLRGRTPQQALRDEKRREDDLRAAGYGMTRWEWAHAVEPARLKAHLDRAGVR